MAKTELGSKHKCQNCGTKFFDLMKDPVVCPKCGEVQIAAAMPAATRATSRAAAKTDDDTDSDEGAETVSLEDADQPEDGQVAPASTDDDADADADDDSSSDDDNTFLEEEEDDDSNVSDLIDGDIENDEER